MLLLQSAICICRNLRLCQRLKPIIVSQVFANISPHICAYYSKKSLDHFESALLIDFFLPCPSGHGVHYQPMSRPGIVERPGGRRLAAVLFSRRSSLSRPSPSQLSSVCLSATPTRLLSSLDLDPPVESSSTLNSGGGEYVVCARPQLLTICTLQTNYSVDVTVVVSRVETVSERPIAARGIYTYSQMTFITKWKRYLC